MKAKKLREVMKTLSNQDKAKKMLFFGSFYGNFHQMLKLLDINISCNMKYTIEFGIQRILETGR